jgi:hypothetical protein
MATKFRKDIDATDIHIAARFKSHLQRGLYLKYIEATDKHLYCYLQQWDNRTGEWRAARKIRDMKTVCGIRLKDFRWIVKMIQREVDIPEGRIVHVLEKMSLFRYQKSTSGWKTDGTPPQILLEHSRLFGGGTIRKRRPKSPAALLEKAEESIAESLKMGLSKEQAMSIQQANGYDQLKREAEAERYRNQERYQLIKEEICGGCLI